MPQHLRSSVVVEHAADLVFEAVGVFEVAILGRFEQLIVRHGIPQEIGQTLSPLPAR